MSDRESNQIIGQYFVSADIQSNCQSSFAYTSLVLYSPEPICPDPGHSSELLWVVTVKSHKDWHILWVVLWFVVIMLFVSKDSSDTPPQISQECFSENVYFSSSYSTHYHDKPEFDLYLFNILSTF